MNTKRHLEKIYCEARPFIQMDNKHCIDFSSNDYLGLRFNEDIQTAYIQGMKEHGIGSGGSSFVCGYDDVKHQLESHFATFLSMEKALLFGAGYTANLSVFMVLLKDEQVDFFIDKSIHASVYVNPKSKL